MSMYVLKKNAGSISNPWLIDFPRFGGFMFGKLSHICTHNAEGVRLKVFMSIGEARHFISEHYNVCSSENIVCEVKFLENGMVFEPIQE